MHNRVGFFQVFIVSALIFCCTSTVFFAEDPEPNLRIFHLKGIEIAKGFDFGSVRYGMTTIGQVLSLDDGEEIGSWLMRLHFKGREDIEACRGSNDIVWLKLEVTFTAGEFAGHRLVLGMNDWRSRVKEDAQWVYLTDPCSIGGLDCECPASDRDFCDSENVTNPDYVSNLAYIDHIRLRKWWGSTLDIEEVWVQDGWLCHHYRFVPRVFGNLVITLREVSPMF